MVVALHSIQFCTYQRVGSLNIICRVGLWVSLLFITCVHDNNNKINIRVKKCTYVYTYIRIHATIIELRPSASATRATSAIYQCYKCYLCY